MQHATIRRIASAVLLPFVVLSSGCATKGAEVQASYVPAARYSDLDCKTLSIEIVEVQTRAGQLSGALDSAAGKDAGLVAVGVILFWPALFFVGGDKGKEAELARMKGEHEALTRAYKQKNCDSQVVPAVQPVPAAAPVAPV
jgi:hypothetical protein